MFIVKTVRKGMMVEATVLEKYWSNAMLAHVVDIVGTSRFVFQSSAKRWAHKEILKVIDKREGLEYING